MKFDPWATAIVCALISFIALFAILERIFYLHPHLREGNMGYLVAVILALVGIAGISVGIIILKKRQILAAGLIGFFLTPIVLAIIVFIFGP